MKWLLVVIVGSLVLAGCTAEFPLKWKPTESQKQAADLTVRDLAALTPHVAPEAQIIRSEAQAAAEVTQTYLGLPKIRAVPVAPQNVQIIADAQTDASRLPPTIAEVGESVIAEGERLATTGFPLAELALTAAGSIAGIWGAGRIKNKVGEWKTTASGAEAKTRETLEALRQIVLSIDKLPDDTKATVKKVQQQSATTEALVAEVRKA